MTPAEIDQRLSDISTPDLVIALAVRTVANAIVLVVDEGIAPDVAWDTEFDVLNAYTNAACAMAMDGYQLVTSTIASIDQL